MNLLGAHAEANGPETGLLRASWGVSVVNCAVQMHPVQDTNHSLLTHHFGKEAAFMLVVSAYFQAEPWHAEVSRGEGRAMPDLSHHSGEHGARHWELCNALPIQENKAVYREYYCLQFRKVLEHTLSVQRVCMKQNLSGFLDWALNVQRGRKIPWEGEIKAPG